MTVQVVQVCIGRFHHFDLARQLAEHRALVRFYTGYPSWKLHGQGIPSARVKTFPWVMTPYMGLVKWSRTMSLWEQPMAWMAHETLDAYVARTLPDCDVLFALSGSGLRSARVAKQRGINFVCDRGSSHIRYQEEILRDEYARWGESFPGIDQRIIDKEEAEYEMADVITVPSEFAFRSFLQMGISPAKLRKVPYGVNLRLFSKTAAPDPNCFDILFVGQVCFRKGVPDLLEAFSRLQHPRKRLKLVGGIQPEMVRYFHRYPPQPGVELVGHLTQPRLKEVMSRSHAMVLPSIEEGLALVQAQALACGCPVIATNHTGATDLFTDGFEGFIVPIRDPQTIADRLQLLAEDPERRGRMGRAALARVKQMGGWDRYGHLMTEVLCDLAGKQPPCGSDSLQASCRKSHGETTAHLLSRA